MQGATVYGQDLSAKDVAAANKALKRYGIAGEAWCGDAAELAFPTNRFDGVISSDFFEHITDDIKAKVLRETLCALKSGVPLVIKTPNLSYLAGSMCYLNVAPKQTKVSASTVPRGALAHPRCFGRFDLMEALS